MGGGTNVEVHKGERVFLCVTTHKTRSHDAILRPLPKPSADRMTLQLRWQEAPKAMK